MKKFILIIALLGPFLESCFVENPGPEGPPGRDGIDGRDGINGKDGEEAFVFEYNFDFSKTEYNAILPYPDHFNMLDSDVALVYLLWEVNSDQIEIWRALPQTLFTNEGTLQYNFDFTKLDVSLFLQADYPLSFVPDNMLEKWIARVVIVPGNFFNTNGRVENSIDFSDYDEVAKYFNLKPVQLDLSNYKSKAGV